MTKTLVFTDMDGTLLDHHTYSFEAAKPALAALKKHDIPVIPTTSKTFAELKPLRENIGLDGPFIIENGAAIFIPHGFFKQKPSGTIWIDGYWCKAFISNKNYWIKLLEKLGSEFDGKYKQFSKMSISEVQEATGLDEHSASLASKRQFGEPILWLGTDEEKLRFIKVVKDRGAFKHTTHISHAAHIPTGNVLIKTCLVCKQRRHIRNLRDIARCYIITKSPSC